MRRAATCVRTARYVPFPSRWSEASSFVRDHRDGKREVQRMSRCTLGSACHVGCDRAGCAAASWEARWGAELTHRHIICAAGHGIRSTSRFQVHTPPGATAWCSHTFITIRAVFYELKKRRSRRSPGGGRNATRRTYNAYGSRFAVAVPRTICLRVIVRGQRASSTMTTQ